MSTNSTQLVDVEKLKVYFPVRGGSIFSRQKRSVKAVNDISFSINENETLGLVGESGCGKSTTGRAILRLIQPTAGQITFDGIKIDTLSKEELRKIRPHMQMIFQDSSASLNPRHSARKIISDPLIVHGAAAQGSKELNDHVEDLMQLVGLNPAYASRFPHEFSGGQRQRIGIARALALNPRFVVCDEPISALDVSIQAQIVNLLQDLQHRLRLSYLFIAHDLNMVRFISNRVAVMYLGEIMELAERTELFTKPLHPYTQSLMSAVPLPDPKNERKRKRIILSGEVPSPANPPPGCVFHTRCPIAIEECSITKPEYRPIGSDHFVACHRTGKSIE
jgi:oligopeptide transport system ATP-binding protein